MKKILFSVLLAIGMTMSATACGGNQSSQAQTEASASVYGDATAVLQAVWDKTEEKFPSFGGNIDNSVENAPGKLDVTDTDTMTYTLLIPEDIQKNITDAATLMHMMNANTFTGAAIKVEGMDAQNVADQIKEVFVNNHFMCGFPDKIVIASVDGYVAYAFGSEMNIDEFKKNVESLENSKILVEAIYE